MTNLELALLIGLGVSTAINGLIVWLWWLERKDSGEATIKALWVLEHAQALMAQERKDLMLSRIASTPAEFTQAKAELRLMEQPREKPEPPAPWEAKVPPQFAGWDVSDGPDEDGNIAFTNDESVFHVHESFWQGETLERALETARRLRYGSQSETA